LRDVRSILDAHYLHRDRALAESAIRKLEMGYAQSARRGEKPENGFYKMTDKSTESCSKRRKS
jgi:hypothetical protein